MYVYCHWIAILFGPVTRRRLKPTMLDHCLHMASSDTVDLVLLALAILCPSQRQGNKAEAILA